MRYKELYFHLFGAVCDAIEEIENNNYGTAKEMLIKAQLECEEKYIEENQNDRP